MSSLFSHGYALLVGVGQCDYSPYSLPATSRDAQALYAVLTDPSHCAYPPGDGHIRLLTDARATREAILEGLAWLQERTAQDGDATAIVYFSGHGWADRSGRYFLIPRDTDPSDIPGSVLSGNAFTSALRWIRAQRLLVILDCCHAAGMATAKNGMKELKLPPEFQRSTPPKQLISALKQGAGRAVFSSSREFQPSWVRQDGQLSVYTHHLIEALKGAGVGTGHDDVRLSNLIDHLGRAVPESARALGGEQTPYFDTASENFPIALLLKGRSVETKTASGSAERPSGNTFNNFGDNNGMQGTFHGPATLHVGGKSSSGDRG